MIKTWFLDTPNMYAIDDMMEHDIQIKGCMKARNKRIQEKRNRARLKRKKK